ncbi:DUF2254 domain-containing protein [Agrococcus terreus]|uniref:DUF2254 domain-containing protein n=1 Tax=Agrococcus terreus TaxID=574649 RepID=UPI00384D5E3C
MGRDRRREPQALDALPRTRSITLWQRAWSRFWVLPLAIVAVAVALGAMLPEIDRAIGDRLPYLFEGGPEGARALLGTIAGAMISVTGLVFSITMVVVQLASSQYSPRVLGDFLASRLTQATLGTFAATFAYALTVLRSVRGDAGLGGAFVPQLAVSAAFLLVLVSVCLFLAFIHHITRSIQVSTIVSRLGGTTLEAAATCLPEPSALGARLGDETWTPPVGMRALEVAAVEHGSVVELDHRGLVARAAEHDAIIEVLPQVGDFVVEGRIALRVWRPADAPELDEAVVDRIRGLVAVEQDRRSEQDPALGVRKLVDIAERALSPGVNDPTTAVQVLDQLHRVVRLAVGRGDLPAVVVAEGSTRLVHRPQRVEQLVALALREPLHYGRGSLQVPRRIASMLDDLEEAALPAHRPFLAHWRREAFAALELQASDTPAAT